MAELTVHDVSEDGTNLTYSAATGAGDTAYNDGRTMLAIANGSGSSITVTVTAQTTSVENPNYGDLSKSNATCAVPAGETQIFGPFSPQAFNDSNADIAISYSAATSVTIAAFKPEDLKR